MWIKSLSAEVWVNITHITHFSIGTPYDHRDHTLRHVTAYLDASVTQHGNVDGVTVKYGTHEECEEFVKEQIFLQTAYQWLGYIVAGGIGALLTLLFGKGT